MLNKSRELNNISALTAQLKSSKYINLDASNVVIEEEKQKIINRRTIDLTDEAIGKVARLNFQEFTENQTEVQDETGKASKYDISPFTKFSDFKEGDEVDFVY